MCQWQIWTTVDQIIIFYTILSIPDGILNFQLIDPIEIFIFGVQKCCFSKSRWFGVNTSRHGQS